MKEHKVDNFNSLHKVFGRFRKDNRWLFRGHSDPSWILRPKAGRAEFADASDERQFRAWKRRAIEFVSLPLDDDWGWLAIAQHHGLATRLLDWTFNPLAATFFAVAESRKTEALVYAYQCSKIVIPENVNPFDVNGVLKFKPMGVAPRIIRQGGLFTIHGEPDQPLEKAMRRTDELEKIVIDRDYRSELVHELSHYGINRATLFPDLDGLSAHVNWAMINRKYWSEPEGVDDAQ